ncbi:MAG: GAF domain-containing protein [Chloroflexota bacterium]
MGIEIEERRESLNLSEAQFQASSAIYGSSDPVAILNALINFGGKSFAEAHLGLIDPNNGLLNVIAVRDRQGVHSAQLTQSLDAYPAYETLSAVEVLSIADVAHDPFLTPQERSMLEARSVGAMLVIPLVVSQRLMGVIDFTNPQPVPLPPELLRSMRNLGDQIAVVFENQALLRDAQASALQLMQQVQVLQGLNRLSTSISSFRSEKELLDYAAQTLVQALNVDHVGIALFEPREDHGTVISEYPDHHAVGAKVETRNSVMVNVLRENPEHPFIADNIATNPMIELETRAVLRKVGVVALMVVALQVSGEIVGTVGFDLYDRSRQFTPERVATAQTMVSQIALSLQNIRLLTDATRRAEQIQRVAAFGQLMQANLRIDTIINIMLGESRHLLPLDRLTVALYDFQHAQLRVAGEYADGKIVVDLENGTVIPMEGTFAGQVWQADQMLNFDDTHTLSGVSRVQELSLRSMMIAPLRSRGRLIGTVSAGSFRPYSYEDADQSIFQQILNQLALAIENAEAYTQSQRVAKNEALINEIATHFQQHSDIEEMMQIAVDELGRALGARRARIRLALQAEPLTSGGQ